MPVGCGFCGRSQSLFLGALSAVAAVEAVGMWAKASISPRSQAARRPRHGTRGKRSRSAKRIVHISTAFFDAPKHETKAGQVLGHLLHQSQVRQPRASTRQAWPSNRPTRFPEDPQYSCSTSPRYARLRSGRRRDLESSCSNPPKATATSKPLQRWRTLLPTIEKFFDCAEKPCNSSGLSVETKFGA